MHATVRNWKVLDKSKNEVGAVTASWALAGDAGLGLRVVTISVVPTRAESAVVLSMSATITLNSGTMESDFESARDMAEKLIHSIEGWASASLELGTMT